MAFDERLAGRMRKRLAMVDAKGVDSDASLKAWVDRSVEFARSLPKK